MPRRRTDIDFSTEESRQCDAALLEIGYAADWRRGQSLYAFSGPDSQIQLDGPFGRLLRQSIQARTGAGEQIKLSRRTDDGQVIQIDTGAYIRWQLLQNCADLTALPHHQLVRELALLYRRAPVVSGEFACPAWALLEGNGAVHAVLAEKLKRAIGHQCVVVRPSLKADGNGTYYPPQLRIVLPSQCWMIEDPARPGQPMAYGERVPDMERRRLGLRGDAHWIWDISDPVNPVWGCWPSAKSWQAGGQPIWSVEGSAYPWQWQGQSRMPAVVFRFEARDAGIDGRELLPARTAELQVVLDLLVDLAFLRMVEKTGAFDTAILLSDSPMNGLHHMQQSPGVLHNLFGPGEKSLVSIPNSTESSARLAEGYATRLEAYAERFAAGFSARKSEKGAQSGVAIELDMSAKLGVRDAEEAENRPGDVALFEMLAATWNYLIRSGQISARLVDETVHYTPTLPPVLDPALLVPEETPEVRYPFWWTATERAELRRSIETAVNAGLKPVEELWCFDADLPYDGVGGVNHAKATEAIQEALAGNLRLAQQGYGLDWAQKNLLARQTVVDETAEYIPGADVAAVASKGLTLRAEFKGRSLALTGLSAGDLLRRAKRLSARDVFYVGEIGQLQSWLEIHASDKDALADVGQWGNDADPSGPYITWLSQGGDAAVTWCQSVLAAPTAMPIPQEAAPNAA